MRIDPRRRLWKYTILFAILAIALVLKAWLIFSEVVPFNSDEAILALMARHILAGERPIFFYGQAYMGSLDAYFIAIGFWLFGQSVWVIRLVQAVLYAGVIVTTYALASEGLASERAGWISALLIAIPNVNVTLYTTATLGGYVEALLIGNLILLVGLRIANRIGKPDQGSDSYNFRPMGLFLILGLLTGAGLWVFGLTLIYSVPTWGVLLWKWIRSERSRKIRSTLLIVAGSGAGILLGSAPWWIYALRNGFGDLIIELTGSAVAVEQTPFLMRTVNHLVNYLLLGTTVTFDLRPPWEVRWLALPLIPFVLLFWTIAILHAVRSVRRNSPSKLFYILLFGVILIQGGAFLFTSFGVDPSGRYFIPLAIPLSIFAADMLLSLPEKFGRWRWIFLALVLINHAWGIAQSAGKNPPGITTQFGSETQIDHSYDAEVIQFLTEKGETRGYTTYWVAYPFAFLSQEELIYIPRLPYHLDFRYTDRDDRYAPYQEIVRDSERVAYITYAHPDLDASIRSKLTQAGITWQEEKIGDYVIFYHLSSRISPEELGLGGVVL